MQAVLDPPMATREARVVTATADNLGGSLLLATHGDNGDDAAGEKERVQQDGDGGDLVGFLSDISSNAWRRQRSMHGSFKRAKWRCGDLVVGCVIRSSSPIKAKRTGSCYQVFVT